MHYICRGLGFEPWSSHLSTLGFVCKFGGEGRGRIWKREIERKLEKPFTFFEKVFFIENDK
jgi:hypothetical protein